MKIADALKRYTPVGLALVFILACCLFFLQRVLRFERQNAAIRQLYRIHQAQDQFKTQQGRYGSQVELEKANLLEVGLNQRNTSFFRYWVSDVTPTTFCAHADRLSFQAGKCDFILCEDGVLYSQCGKSLGSVMRGQGVKGLP